MGEPRVMRVPKRADYPKTEDEARQAAIAWQLWQSDKSLSQGIHNEWTAYFTELGKKFELTEEFSENGII
jgi:hypothetical protein